MLKRSFKKSLISFVPTLSPPLSLSLLFLCCSFHVAIIVFHSIVLLTHIPNKSTQNRMHCFYCTRVEQRLRIFCLLKQDFIFVMKGFTWRAKNVLKEFERNYFTHFILLPDQIDSRLKTCCCQIVSAELICFCRVC